MQPPPPDYCLLFIDWWPFCMSKGEWASWAQAIGSVVGLAVAVGVPIWQRRRDRREAWGVALHFAKRVAYNAASLAAETRENGRAKILTSREQLTAALEQARSLRFDLMPADRLEYVHGLQSIAGAMLRNIEFRLKGETGQTHDRVLTAARENKRIVDAYVERLHGRPADISGRGGEELI